MNALNPSTIVLLVFIPLFAWRIYKRFRRMVGRQRLSKKRLTITFVLYPTLILFLALGAHDHPQRLLGLAGGLLLGCGLGVIGLKKTVFEPTKNGLFYTPHAHIGIAVSLLFFARVAWRLMAMYSVNQHLPQDPNNLGSSPLTLAVFGLLAAYYITYAIGLARWRHGLILAKQEREAMQPAAEPK